MRDALPDGAVAGVRSGGAGAPPVCATAVSEDLQNAQEGDDPARDRGNRAVDPAPVLARVAVLDHPLPASRAVVLADHLRAVLRVGRGARADDRGDGIAPVGLLPEAQGSHAPAVGPGPGRGRSAGALRPRAPGRPGRARRAGLLPRRLLAGLPVPFRACRQRAGAGGSAVVPESALKPRRAGGLFRPDHLRHGALPAGRVHRRLCTAGRHGLFPDLDGAGREPGDRGRRGPDLHLLRRAAEGLPGRGAGPGGGPEAAQLRPGHARRPAAGGAGFAPHVFAGGDHRGGAGGPVPSGRGRPARAHCGPGAAHGGRSFGCPG